MEGIDDGYRHAKRAEDAWNNGNVDLAETEHAKAVECYEKALNSATRSKDVTDMLKLLISAQKERIKLIHDGIVYRKSHSLTPMRPNLDAYYNSPSGPSSSNHSSSDHSPRNRLDGSIIDITPAGTSHRHPSNAPFVDSYYGFGDSQKQKQAPFGVDVDDMEISARMRDVLFIPDLVDRRMASEDGSVRESESFRIRNDEEARYRAQKIDEDIWLKALGGVNRAFELCNEFIQENVRSQNPEFFEKPLYHCINKVRESVRTTLSDYRDAFYGALEKDMAHDATQTLGETHFTIQEAQKVHSALALKIYYLEEEKARHLYMIGELTKQRETEEKNEARADTNVALQVKENELDSIPEEKAAAPYEKVLPTSTQLGYEGSSRFIELKRSMVEIMLENPETFRDISSRFREDHPDFVLNEDYVTIKHIVQYLDGLEKDEAIAFDEFDVSYLMNVAAEFKLAEAVDILKEYSELVNSGASTSSAASSASGSGAWDGSASFYSASGSADVIPSSLDSSTLSDFSSIEESSLKLDELLLQQKKLSEKLQQQKRNLEMIEENEKNADLEEMKKRKPSWLDK